MPFIEYRGHADVVDVPAHRLGGVLAGTPVEVTEDVAADLTAGDPDNWVRVDDAEARGRLADLAAGAADAPEQSGEQTGDNTVTEA